jgi:hypothetical protein
MEVINSVECYRNNNRKYGALVDQPAKPVGGSVVSFKVVASGTGTLTYMATKRHIDQAFISIPAVQSFISKSEEIRLDNVEVRYRKRNHQVLVSNGSLSVTSSPVILSVSKPNIILPTYPNQPIVN